MRMPVIAGVIDRRILANFRVRPEVLARVLPAPFRPTRIRGWGLAGICLIRLREIRPPWLRRVWGLSSENAAHRIAVEWDDRGRTRQGVFIPRRDTSSRLNTLLGGRVFPGVHHHARFDVQEGDGRYRLRLQSDDGGAALLVEATVAQELPTTSLFGSLAEASRFFQEGSVGYSVSPIPGEFDALELSCADWSMEPLGVQKVESSYFQDESRFPPGSVVFDSALLMKKIRHEWHRRDSLTEACRV